MSQVCKKHQEKPEKIYGKCIGCEIEWLNQRIREQEELLKFYREQLSINTNNMKQLQKRIEELQLEVNDWRAEVQKWQKFYKESEESHSETKELLHSTISENKRYKQALEEIARGRFSGASYKARKALEGEEDA